MAENKPIINIIFDGLNHRVKNIGEKCLNFQKQNKNLKEQLARKTQECDELREELDKVYEDIKLSPLCYKCSEEDCLRKEIDKLKAEKEQAEQKLEKIRQICNCSKSQMNCEQCPMCDECEELCANDENLQNIILQIIDEVE